MNSQYEKLNNDVEDFAKNLKEVTNVNEDPNTQYKAKKEISISSLINNISIKETEINSLQSLEIYFENLKNILKGELLSELKEYDLVIKK